MTTHALKIKTTLGRAVFIFNGGDWVSLLETRPLEDILADIADGWNDMQRCIGRVRAGVATEVSYVL